MSSILSHTLVAARSGFSVPTGRPSPGKLRRSRSTISRDSLATAIPRPITTAP